MWLSEQIACAGIGTNHSPAAAPFYSLGPALGKHGSGTIFGRSRAAEARAGQCAASSHARRRCRLSLSLSCILCLSTKTSPMEFPGNDTEKLWKIAYNLLVCSLRLASEEIQAAINYKGGDHNHKVSSR